MKRNEGFTLIELVVVILVATIVAAAAGSTLLMGMKMHKASTEQAKQQMNASFVLTALEDIASEAEIAPIEASGGSCWINNADGETLFQYDAAAQAIYLGSATASTLLENVTAFEAVLEENLLTITIVVDEKEYTSKVYCRLIEVTEPSEEEGGNGNQEQSQDPPAQGLSTFSFRTSDTTASDFLSTNWLAISFSDQRQNFLSVLEGELGSTGASVATGEYFSEWYIGSYADNPGWDENTPWCACFVSWALAQCSDDLMYTPRFAHVDKFMEDFSLGFWREKDPSPGDVIFFDWTEGGDGIPEHVGVVTSVEGGQVCTIEGNADGKVARRSYSLDDGRILGYGVLKWK